MHDFALASHLMLCALPQAQAEDAFTASGARGGEAAVAAAKDALG